MAADQTELRFGAAAAIKSNNGRQQDTISSQTYKMKPCNESADVICASREQEGRDRKRWGGGVQIRADTRKVLTEMSDVM